MIRQAATLLLVRSAGDEFEVLLGKRGRNARFVAGAHVFPGGGVDPDDGGTDATRVAGGRHDPWKMAAVREAFEEVGILVGSSQSAPAERQGGFYETLRAAGLTIDLDALHYLSTWVTPPGLPWRYDTRFFLAEADQDPSIDGYEFVEASWITPGAALAKAEQGLWAMVSPTIAHLRFLSSFPDVESLREGLSEGRHSELIDQYAVEGFRHVASAVEP